MTARPHVLHVDDDPSIREVVRLMLETLAGFRVESVASGQAAVDSVSRGAPDLVLLDVMMPGMDGPQTLAALRALPGGADLPVVFLTAKVLRRDMQQLQGLGAAAIVQKPFKAAELIAELRRVLADAGS